MLALGSLSDRLAGVWRLISYCLPGTVAVTNHYRRVTRNIPIFRDSERSSAIAPRNSTMMFFSPHWSAFRHWAEETISPGAETCPTEVDTR